jgi:hypothetical protein
MLGEVKNIRNFVPFDRLYAFLKTEGGFKEPPQLETNVQPTVDISSFNEVPQLENQLTTTTTDTHVFTVPFGKKWRITHAYALRANAGPIDIVAYEGSSQLTLFAVASATVGQMTGQNDVILVYGQTLQFIYGAGTSGSLKSMVLYIESDMGQ